ncbi:hypothetical protein LCGC14_1692520 [marine sediment metagenome]|uniref:Helix-turn-helix domain-containing protein n=1 Tax=marine sediment metagenome TaxID=412755 RepID=A0A0F9KKG9_9ZZZZ
MIDMEKVYGILEKNLEILRDMGDRIEKLEAVTIEVMDLAQAAKFLQFNERTLRKLTREGKVPAKKIGGSWRYSKSRLLDWLAES